MSTPSVSVNPESLIAAFEQLAANHRQLKTIQQQTTQNPNRENLTTWKKWVDACEEALSRVVACEQQLSPEDVEIAVRKLLEKGVVQSLQSTILARPQSTPVPEQTSSSLTDRVQRLSLEGE